MKRNLKRILSLALLLILMFSISVAAYAATGGNIYNTGWAPNVPNNPKPPTTPSKQYGPTVTIDEFEVEFNGGNAEQGKLDVDPALLDEEGDYAIKVKKGELIPLEEIPDTLTTDNYYKFVGWVTYEDYNNGVFTNFIDFETYTVEDDIKFVAVYEDTWVPYKDMKQDRSDWFYKFVRDLAIAGVVNGTPEGDFLATSPLTYGQALKLIMRATGYPEYEPTGFNWASGYYTKALEDGLVEDTEIDLEDPITRREVAEIIVKALKLDDPTIETPFADTDLDVAIAVYEAGLMIGTENEDGEIIFMPENDITRAEISTIVWRIYKYFTAL